MEWYQICSLVVSVLTLCGFGTLMGQIISERREKKKAETKEAVNQASKQRQDEIRGIIKEEIKPVLVDIEKMQENDHTHRKALQALLRDRLYKIHAECFERGYTTLEDRENFRNLYTQYHGLGQNGVMDNTYKKMFELATEEEWKKNQEQYI